MSRAKQFEGYAEIAGLIVRGGRAASILRNDYNITGSASLHELCDAFDSLVALNQRLTAENYELTCQIAKKFGEVERTELQQRETYDRLITIYNESNTTVDDKGTLKRLRAQIAAIAQTFR